MGSMFLKPEALCSIHVQDVVCFWICKSNFWVLKFRCFINPETCFSSFDFSSKCMRNKNEMQHAFAVLLLEIAKLHKEIHGPDGASAQTTRIPRDDEGSRYTV
ncbi:uncharacterized protein LOC105187944 isoform X1 [Harpegnathos saltator]|uniref:uncharacterized protein LOC105187944 isoform X1 n=1 Tax=Harpegnathos saltator TaxID=610380 RepID=UPI000DBEDBC6|nr:uncharacterized protein LOC105187944 isoform X1 [Harpegnathos saltator]